MSHFSNLDLMIRRERKQNQKTEEQIAQEDFVENLKAEQNLELRDYINR